MKNLALVFALAFTMLSGAAGIYYLAHKVPQPKRFPKPPTRERAAYTLKLAAAIGYSAGLAREPWTNVASRVEQLLP